MYDGLRTPRAASLRTKLSVIFVGLVVVPCLTLTVLVSTQLAKAIEFWGNPGVRRSITSSVAVARETLRILEVHLTATVGQAAALGSPEAGDFDVWRIYERRGDGFVLEAAEPSGVGAILTSREIEAALAGGPAPVIGHPDGWLLAVAPLDSAGHRALVGGYRVSPELKAQIEEARRGAQLIGPLGVYQAVSKGWVWISALLVSVFVLGGAVLLARRLARGLTRPIEDMVRAMIQLGRGEPVRALAPPADREMGYLVRSFNRMADELEHSRRELRRAERLAAWQDVARHVAHEIKNPLTPIQFAIHRLKKQLAISGGERAAVGESLDSILGEVETLRAIADTFSQLARLPDPTFERLRAAEILREVVELYQQPEIERRLLLDDDLPEVLGDRRQLRQVFNNLVQNAVEAMPRGGSLTVRAGPTPDGRQVSFEILDTGGGIPEACREKIWAPYFTTKPKGSGIGLAVVSKIVRDHRGRIELENRPQGGVSARVVLPVAETGDGAAAPATADGDGAAAADGPGQRAASGLSKS